MDTKPIKGHPDYYITNKGDVYKKLEDTYKKLRPNMSNGHARVWLGTNHYYIDRLVMEHFSKPQPSPIYKVFHIDGDQENNEVTNLTWLTPSEIQRYSKFTSEYRKEFLCEF